MGYDVIGDIHGHATKLKTLLGRMGYEERGGALRHPERQTYFVGDFIDRGPEQLETLDIVRRMIDVGGARAVMGNHEFNAIAWATPDPHLPGEFLRPHGGEKGEKNRRQHADFLRAVGEDSPLHREWVGWFKTLPLWLELPELRVVHACWHLPSMALLAEHLAPGNLLSEPLLVPVMRKLAGGYDPTGPTPNLYGAAEALLQGLEVPLPSGLSFQDKDGHVRKDARIRWWDAGAKTFRTAAMTADDDPVELPDEPIPADLSLGYEGDRPVFFGHYWLWGKPARRAEKVACVDYSAGRGGPLCAYRSTGRPVVDAVIEDANFLTTDA